MKDRMSKGILYYTSNQLEEPTFSACQREIQKAGLPIVSISLKPLNFGSNSVLNRKPGFITYMLQIFTGLLLCDFDQVFFCEHDCLYPRSHFDFTVTRNDMFYYNDNVWRWDYPNDRAITYDRLISLSSMTCDTRLARDHYRLRINKIYDNGWENDLKPEPGWARKWGYEPGTKKKRRGGFSDEDFETFASDKPIIDIRHGNTISKRKTTLDSFKHVPKNWRETKAFEIKGWDLKKIWQ